MMNLETKQNGKLTMLSGSQVILCSIKCKWTTRNVTIYGKDTGKDDNNDGNVKNVNDNNESNEANKENATNDDNTNENNHKNDNNIKDDNNNDDDRIMIMTMMITLWQAKQQ